MMTHARGRARVTRGAVVALAGAGALVAGILATGGSASAALRSATPPSGGTFTFALAGLPATLDPFNDYIKYEGDGAIMSAIFGNLAYQVPGKGTVVNSLVKSDKPSNDFKTWTVTLHPGLKFTDGTPFNAAAVAYNMQYAANPNANDGYGSVLAKMHETVVNATTLKVTEPSPDTAFPEEMAQDFPFVGSPTAIKNQGITDFGLHPVGAGPFKLSSFVQNSTINLVRNPGYSSFAKGQPYLDKVIFQNLPNSQTQVINALGADTAQMTWLQGDQQIKEARNVGAKVQEFHAGGGEFLIFNNSEPPFNNLLAREAVYYGLDHQSLASSWTPGLPAMNNLFPKGSPFYEPKYNFPAKSAAKATKMFQQLQSSGHPLQFTCSGLIPYTGICSYVQSALSKYPGVKVAVQLVDPAQYAQDQEQGTYQMLESGSNFVNPIPELLNVLNGPEDYEKWHNPTVASASKKLLATTNPATEKKLWESIETQFLKDYPIYTAQSSVLGLAYLSDKIGGITPVEFGAFPLFGPLYLKST